MFALPNKTTICLHSESNHVINQAVFVPDTSCLVLFLVGAPGLQKEQL
jgi:hypothetical protein